jgi:hypothetical protein
MRLNKEYDSLTQSLSLAIQQADDCGEREMKEMLGLLMQFYLNNEEVQFHKYFMQITAFYRQK